MEIADSVGILPPAKTASVSAASRTNTVMNQMLCPRKSTDSTGSPPSHQSALTWSR